jgi:signal transduction histidine kinase
MNTSSVPRPSDAGDLPDFLFDPLPPEVVDARADDAEPLLAMTRRIGRNLGSLIGLFFVSTVFFVICVTLFSLGAGLAVVVVGLFVLVACLMAAAVLSRTTKVLLRYAGVDLPDTHYPPTGTGFGMLRRLKDPQSWRDLAHVLVAFVVSTFSFSVAISWVAGGLGGLTYWFWQRFLPSGDRGLAALLGFPGTWPEIVLNSVLGALLVVTLPVVLHGLVQLHALLARALLVDERSALRARVSELTQSRSAAGEAEAHTLRRLERDLHDGPQQRLVRLGMDISTAERQLDREPERARELLQAAYQQSQDALAEIRQLSRGIAPPILAEQGLAAAVTALAARNGVPTTVDVADVALTEAGRNAAYFVVAESLANMEKHSVASWCAVEISAVGGVAVIVITDDGVGGAAVSRGHGLAGLEDRLAGVDGRLTVASPVGGPTQVTATIPLAA